MPIENVGSVKRVTKNAAMLYLRMAVMMLVSFYTSRVILDVLGVTDFGIYSVVCGVTSVVIFFSGSLSNATQRYYNLSLGQSNLKLTSQYFNQFVFIFFFSSFLIIIIGELCMNS